MPDSEPNDEPGDAGSSGDTEDHGDFFGVIPAGGSGTRLWPLSRASHPKFLQPLTGTDRSLLQATYDRLRPLTGSGRAIVVTGVAHADAVAAQLPELPAGHIVAEPAPRDSCAAIGLAAALIERRAPGAIMGSFAADHLINDAAAFRRSVRTAIGGARAGHLMTIGITPTRPETGYGYLRCGQPAGGGQDRIRPVAEFKEKPALEAATGYLASGEYLWNASMFVWRTDVFLAELARQQPDIHAGLAAIADAWDRPDRDAVLADQWSAMPRIAVDYAVMEGAAAAGKVATVAAGFDWHDVGDFDTLGELLAGQAGQTGEFGDGTVVLGTADRSTVVTHDSERLVVASTGGRLVAAVGLSDVVVVDTPDAVLVCRRDRAQDVKALTEILRQRGQADYL